MLQAAVCDGLSFDVLTLGLDHLGSVEVDVGGREVIDTLMIADVVVVLDEGADLPFEARRGCEAAV